MAGCQDINGNTVDCTSQSAIYAVDSSGYLTPNNPVSILASSPSNNGGSALAAVVGALGGLVQPISNAIQGPTNQNITRPLMQTPSTASLAGGSGFFLVIIAVVIAFFAFGRKRTA